MYKLFITTRINTIQKYTSKKTYQIEIEIIEKKLKHLKYIWKRSKFATFDMLLYRKTKKICKEICMITLTNDTTRLIFTI